MTNQDLIVHIIDDNVPNRELFQDLMDSADLAWRSYENAIDFLNRFQPENAGCLILDVRMPHMSGLELMQRLSEEGMTVPVVMTTAHGDVPMAIQAMKLGAFDFQEKPIDNRLLVESVRNAFAKRASQLETADTIAEECRAYDSLTARERDVCALVVSGAMNKQIAYDLDISQRTVEVHRANVMTKMNAKSLAELIRMMIRIEAVE